MGETVKVVIPTIGESVNEGTIGRWFFKEGDVVSKDQTLFELDSDKATLEVPASASGKLSILVEAGKTATVGATVAMIEISEGLSAAKNNGSSSKPKVEAKQSTSTPIAPAAPQKTVSTPTTTASPEALKTLSPSKRKAYREGTFKIPSGNNPFEDDTATQVNRVPMTTIRKKIAARLVESQQTTATLTTFNEIDMTAVNAVRQKLKDSFQSKYGVKLGFMSFFSKAVISALGQYPDVNGRIENDDIVYPQFINLGIAVSTERGLVVPVIKGAQSLSYSALELKIADLAERARTQKLQIPEMSGGTFTITNGGTFGSLISTPIINPPQSGILGMHKIEHRPIAIAKGDGSFGVEVRPMMYVALSYDHRLIDGATSVGFLVKVKEYLEKVTEADIS